MDGTWTGQLELRGPHLWPRPDGRRRRMRLRFPAHGICADSTLNVRGHCSSGGTCSQDDVGRSATAPEGVVRSRFAAGLVEQVSIDVHTLTAPRGRATRDIDAGDASAGTARNSAAGGLYVLHNSRFSQGRQWRSSERQTTGLDLTGTKAPQRRERRMDAGQAVNAPFCTRARLDDNEAPAEEQTASQL